MHSHLLSHGLFSDVVPKTLRGVLKLEQHENAATPFCSIHGCSWQFMERWRELSTGDETRSSTGGIKGVDQVSCSNSDLQF